MYDASGRQHRCATNRKGVGSVLASSTQPSTSSLPTWRNGRRSCELSVDVTSHIIIQETLGSGRAGCWGRGRDRPFCHSYTKVSTPVSQTSLWQNIPRGTSRCSVGNVRLTFGLQQTSRCPDAHTVAIVGVPRRCSAKRRRLALGTTTKRKHKSNTGTRRRPRERNESNGTTN